MAVEEVVVSMPGLDASQRSDPTGKPNSPRIAPASEPTNPLLTEYRTALQARDAFALTKAAHARKHATFGMAYKGLLKKLSSQATTGIDDRTDRARVRTLVYNNMTLLAEETLRDQARLKVRARQWQSVAAIAMSIALIAVAGVLVTSGMV